MSSADILSPTLWDFVKSIGVPATGRMLPFAIFVIWLAVILIIIRITMEESNISYSEIRWNRIANNASLHGGKILGLITNEKNSSVEVTEKFKEIKKIEKPK